MVNPGPGKPESSGAGLPGGIRQQFLPLVQPLSGSEVESQEPVHVTSRPVRIIFFGRMIVGTNNVDEVAMYKSLNLWTPMVCLWLYRSLHNKWQVTTQRTDYDNLHRI